jgi:hypothetical protein
LLPVFGSGGVLESDTTAVLAYDPAALAVTGTVMVTVAPLAIGVAKVHVMGAVPVQVPEVVVTVPSVKPVAAQVSFTMTLFAADGPLFFTVMV